jgi:hypothetical protein
MTVFATTYVGQPDIPAGLTISEYRPSSGSSSRTTSPPIAHRWHTAPTPPRSATFASPRPEGVYGAGPVGSPGGG